MKRKNINDIIEFFTKTKHIDFINVGFILFFSILIGNFLLFIQQYKGFEALVLIGFLAIFIYIAFKSFLKINSFLLIVAMFYLLGGILLNTRILFVGNIILTTYIVFIFIYVFMINKNEKKKKK